jgi:hypothetical protein
MYADGNAAATAVYIVAHQRTLAVLIELAVFIQRQWRSGDHCTLMQYAQGFLSGHQ